MGVHPDADATGRRIRPAHEFPRPRSSDGRGTADQAARMEAYMRIQQIIAEEVPHLYTNHTSKFQVANQRVDGMYVSYTDFNPGLRTACVTE